MIIYNEKQLECIKHPPAPLMIIAGAGTGKTTTIIGRIAHLIEERSINPTSILALTYTVKASKNLKDKIEEIVGDDAQKIKSYNFHSFAFNQIKENYQLLGYQEEPKLIEANESKFLINSLFKQHIDIIISSEYKKDYSLACKNVPKLFDRFRDEHISISKLKIKLEKLIKSDSKEESDRQMIDAISLYILFQDLKKKESWIDFGDMISGFWELMENQTYLNSIQSEIKHIVVDEYQDNNYALSQIVKKLITHTNSVTVVGDDDQSIYSFRGANVLGFTEFRDAFSVIDGYKEVVLDLNYRSTQSILDFSHEVVQNNDLRFKDSSLVASSPNNTEVLFYSGDRQSQLKQIEVVYNELLSKGREAKNISILTRSSSNALEVSNYLKSRGIANSYESGKLFELDTVKDFISFINVILNGRFSDIGLYRLISRSSIKEILRNRGGFVDIKDTLSGGRSPSMDSSALLFLDYIIDKQNNMVDIDLVNSFYQFAVKFMSKDPVSLNVDLDYVREIVVKFNDVYRDKIGEGICDYLNTLFELNDILLNEKSYLGDELQVMTVHQSKGMEFDHVIIPFLSSGSFPARNYKDKGLNNIPPGWLRDDSLISDDNISEERRIFHVACTRAKEDLYLLGTEKRKSKFFSEISESRYTKLDIKETFESSSLKPSFDFKYSQPVHTKFSATNLASYEKCPLLFKLKNLDNVYTKSVTKEASVGILVHRALELIFERSKFEHSQIISIIDEVWDSNYFSSSYQSDEYRKEVQGIVLSYVSSNPKKEDVDTLLEFDLELDMGLNKFVGKVDRIDISRNGDVEVYDYKTSSSKSTSSFLKKNIQLGYYSYILQKKYPNEKLSKLPMKVTMEHVRFPDNPGVSIVVSDEDIIDIENRILGIAEEVKDSTFSPKKNGYCYFCDYKRLLCPLYK